MIPKKIHYCWFGHNPLSKMAKKCIASWKKYCTDYEIIEWNEDNFDIHCCPYVEEAYKAKKWAFVSDYCRYYVLYKYGGTYLDTDVELIKGLDNISENCIGFESELYVSSGLVRRADKGDKICELMLNSYALDNFINSDGTQNNVTVCIRETEIFKSFGLITNNQMQTVEGTTVYSKEWFNPFDFKTGKVMVTPNTVSIHHYSASWMSPKDRFITKIKRKIRKIVDI